MKAPIRRLGGKTRMLGKLLQLVPEHHTYVEVFGGAGHLLCAKQPSPVEVYNDIDGGLVNFYRVVRSRDMFPEFVRMTELTPYSRKEFYTCAHGWENMTDPVEKAWAWFVTNRQAFGGYMESKHWGFSSFTSSGGMASSCKSYLAAVKRLPELHQRLQRVQVEDKDWRFMLDTYDRRDTFFYLDPPYVADTRVHGSYVNELDDSDHSDLVECLLEITGQAMVSGYDHPIYDPLAEAGWTKDQFRTTCNVVARTRKSGLQGTGALTKTQQRTEIVWRNFETQLTLF